MDKATKKQLEDEMRVQILNELQAFIDNKHDTTYRDDAEFNSVKELKEELKNSLNEILDKINSARLELSAISMMAKERNIAGFGSVEDELSAIVSDTEYATNQILDAADIITDIVNANPENISEELINSIKDKTMDIVMACSFQDITGQRVQKVVEVIQLIDNKIDDMEKKLSDPNNYEEDGSTSEFSRKSQRDAGLLNGPALPSDSINQDNIDNLFND